MSAKTGQVHKIRRHTSLHGLIPKEFAALESVLAWVEGEGLDAPCLKAAGELLEELSSDRLERGDCPLISTRQT